MTWRWTMIFDDCLYGVKNYSIFFFMKSPLSAHYYAYALHQIDKKCYLHRVHFIDDRRRNYCTILALTVNKIIARFIIGQKMVIFWTFKRLTADKHTAEKCVSTQSSGVPVKNVWVRRTKPKIPPICGGSSIGNFCKIILNIAIFFS